MKQLIPFLFLFLFSCKQEVPDIPKDIIPMEKMKIILADMHIADAVAETKAQAGGNEQYLSRSYNEQVFKTHGLTKQEFLKSFHFYEEHPVLLNRMYEDILTELSKRSEADSKK